LKHSLGKNNINIEQAFYGEVNRGHSCIYKTFEDSELTSKLVATTDRPSALPPGIDLQPYYTGMALLEYFVFTKTFSDPFATRSGMVFTHVLIVKLNDLKIISNLRDVFSHFVDSVPKDRMTLDTIQTCINDKIELIDVSPQPLFIKKTISSLLNGSLPILFSGEINGFYKALEQIWNSPNSELKKKLKFRASFTPVDIEGIDDLTIVFIQKDFLTKWGNKEIIHSEENELVKITSLAEALFLGVKEGNPFYSFLLELNSSPKDFLSFGLFDKVYKVFSTLDQIEDANIVRQNIRILSKISPLASDGIVIKNRFISRLSDLVDLGFESNLKALRNIDWNSFEKGEETAKNIIANFLKRELNKSAFKTELIWELLDLSFSELKRHWWHNSIHATFKELYTNYNKQTIINLWKLILYSEKSLVNIFELLPVTSNFESTLRMQMPNSIGKSIGNLIEPIAKQRNWYLFHADLILKYLELQKAIISQLNIEIKHELKDSVGLIYISGKVSDSEMLQVTLKCCDDKLIRLTVNRILKSKSLLKELNVNNSCWLNIWVLTLEKTKDFSYGLENREVTTVYSILDLIINNQHVPDIIFESISKSSFLDISNYKNRSSCWGKIPQRLVSNFVEVTAKNVLKMFLSDEILIDSIEKPLQDYISSDTHMTNFLSGKRDDIISVLKLYKYFGNLKDAFLSDYIKYYRKNISKEESVELGKLVFAKNYSYSAQSIYEKSRYNNSFVPAFEQCKPIVKIGFWDNLFGDFQKKGASRISQHEQFNQFKMTPTVVILTAIQEEYKAVRKHLKFISDADQNNTSYEAGVFEFNGKQIAKVIIRECGAKNTNASQEAERAIQNFSPDCIFFVGIAGSRKPKDFAVGDVIFPEKIYSYEGGKSEKDSFRARPDFADTDYALKELSKKERTKGDWKVLIKGEYPNEVKADLGIIASGDQVVEHYNSAVGEILTEHYNDASVVEMEGFGFAKAANRQGRQTKSMIVGVVRGISDIIGQPDENKDKIETDKRPANVKKLASNTAAAFTYWLIYKTYE